MSTTANGYIIDVTDDEGVAIIPAPPSPQEMNTLNPINLSSGYDGISTTIASVGSSCPSRDSVSAAIALVRAKQVAKSAILRAEEQILRPRSVSSDQTSTSITTESSTKEKLTNVNEIVESENAVPIISQNRDKLTSNSNTGTGSPSVDSRQRNRNFSTASVTSSCKNIEVHKQCSSLPRRPSFEQNLNQPSVTLHSSSDDIPDPPSLANNDSIVSDFDETVDANTIEDVNAFLSRLGVGALHSASNESNNSIDRLRMISSGSIGDSSNEVENIGLTRREVQPENPAEISAIIDAVVEKHGEREEQKEAGEVLPKKQKPDTDSYDGENAELQASTSQLSPLYELLDPPSTFALETQSQKVDPPGPSQTFEAATIIHENEVGSPFAANSFSGESLEDSPSPRPSTSVKDEKNIGGSNGDDVNHEEFETRFVDKPFVADVRKTLSTVEEVASIEAEDDDNSNDICEGNYDALDSEHASKDNVSHPSTISAVASEEQKSVYGADGRKEPRGIYEKAKVEVETIPVSNIGVEEAIKNDMSLMSTDSQRVETERHPWIGINETNNKIKVSENLNIEDSASSSGSRGLSETGSLPWALRDVASEETMRATGRRRPRFVVSGPRPSNKSRNVASLFDDSSQQASEAASEFRNDLSFGSYDRSGDDGRPGKSDENDDAIEFKTSDSLEADRCMVDTLLYNDYDLDTDIITQRSIRNENQEHNTMQNVGKDLTDSSNMIIAENGEVEMMTQDKTEDLDDQKVKRDPSGEMIELEVGQGALSPTKVSKIVATMDDQQMIGANQIRNQHHLKELITPIIDGHKPSFVEMAQVREAAKKANVSLEVIDQFLDYVADSTTDDHSLISKSWESFNVSKSWESFNEDDDDIDAFFVRVEAARVAAAKKAISDAAADVEAMLMAEEEATTKATTAASTEIEAASATGEDRKGIDSISSCVGKNQSNSFLHQFEDLDLKADLEAGDGVQLDETPAIKSQNGPMENIVNTMSPKMLMNHFSNLDQRKFEGENEKKLVIDFKRLMMPVINGKKPSVIEEAQIRQAALKANVPLDFVDTFVDYVKDENPELVLQVSTEEEPDFLLKGWEEIEDLDEDDAIAAFLSSKFGEQNSEEKEIRKNGDYDSSESKALRKKKPKELRNAVSRDYEPSITSTIEKDFNRSEDSEGKPHLSKSKDCDVEPDLNKIGPSETDSHTIKNETDYEVVRCESSGINDLGESKNTENETNEDSLCIPEVVETSTKDKTDPIDMEILKACKSIEKYDDGIWQRRTAMATYGWGWEEATWLSPKTSPKASNLSVAGIHSLATSNDLSNFMFNKKAFPLARKNCKLSYNRRVKAHAGYFDVDMYSLQEAAAFGEENLYKDETPWELRHVRQRFLHERSLTFSRNWFGALVKTSGNDKIKAPICKPKSMEMPMRKIPDPGDWTPEWYTTWGDRKLLLRSSRSPSSDSSSVSFSDSYTEKDCYDKDSLRSYSTGGSSYEDDEDWEDAPECGTFVNTKQKIGEHVTRVHPDYTSSLRRSRWRKKYFPIGTFPY